MAALDPPGTAGSVSANANWDDEKYKFIVKELVGRKPIYSRFFEPIRDKLVDRLIVELSKPGKQRVMERSFAARILAHYCASEPQNLVEALMSADTQNFPILFDALNNPTKEATPPPFPDEAKSLLLAELDKKPDGLADGEREKLAERQANAAVALLRSGTGDHDKIWKLLEHTPDPRVRSYLINRMAPMGVEPRLLIDRFNVEKEVSSRRALILSLGEFKLKDTTADKTDPVQLESGTTTIERSQVKQLLVDLSEIYRTDPDPGMHAASEWLLKRWNSKLPELTKIKGEGHDSVNEILEKGWYVNTAGQTMIVLPNDRGNGQARSSVTQERTIVISASLVTNEQFAALQESKKVVQGPGTDPISDITWLEAARFCNRLSEKAGIPSEQWCYDEDPIKDTNVRTIAERYSNELISSLVTMKPDNENLFGYRLPMVAELKDAIRAGSITSRHFGETDQLLGQYGWYVDNAEGQKHAVGEKRPNDFGLFDAHGNVFSWTQLEVAAKDRPQFQLSTLFKDLQGMLTNEQMVLGGSFLSPASEVRSDQGQSIRPANRLNFIGFRVVRTVIAGDNKQDHDPAGPSSDPLQQDQKKGFDLQKLVPKFGRDKK